MSDQADTTSEDKQEGTSSDGAGRRPAGSLKKGRGFLEEGMNRQPLKFDSPYHDDLHLAGAREREVDDPHQQWRGGDTDWDSTALDSDSRGGEGIDKGKGKAKVTPFNTDINFHHPSAEHRKQQRVLNAKRHAHRPMQWTRQKSPFHTSQIGKLATQPPHSIGLFKPDYPFTPSGRKKKKKKPTSSTTDSDAPSALPTTFKYEYSLDPAIVNSNVMRHGWTAAILDDDVKLSVPDESRRSRQTKLYNRELLGKKWFRWSPGEGWVFCRTKDLSAYRNGPGIALGQLLPPRGKAVTSQLPVIPNDSKRDFVWILAVCMIIFSLIAFIRDYRRKRSSKRKGKRRNRSSENVGYGLVRPRSSTLTSRKTKRSQAQHFRDLCQFALRKSVNGVGQAASSTTTGLANIGLTSGNVNGFTSGRPANGSAIRRGPAIFHEDTDGARIELLEKGGVDGNTIVSPVRETGYFDLHVVSTSEPGDTDEKSR